MIINARQAESRYVLGYLPQLDGIRGVAISWVLLSHFFPSHFFINQVVHWGRLGVILFFVLSGFLITGILLRVRADGICNGSSPWQIIRSFYARRFLRIFPIYYVSIFVIAALDYDIRKDLFWYTTYMSNISEAFLGGQHGYAIHLWSLCVEEHFYLIWPWIVIFASSKTLRRILITFVLLSVSYKFFGSCFGLSWSATTRPVFGNFDSLALGSFLALYRHDCLNNKQTEVGQFTICGMLAFVVLCSLQYFRASASVDARTVTIYVTLLDVSASFSFLLLIATAARNSNSFIGKFLGWSPIRYLGKVSYGVYLYHPFVAHGIRHFKASLGIQLDMPALGWFFVYTFSSIVVAVVSWHVFESPINSLKRRLPYVLPATETTSRHKDKSACSNH